MSVTSEGGVLMQGELVPNTVMTVEGAVRWGSFGRGQPLVLLHGTPLSSSVWREVLPGLTSFRQVFVWDMPGFGKSEQRATQDVSLAAQARVFAQLLLQWSLPAPAVVAHDVGGVVASKLEDGSHRGLRPTALAEFLRPWCGERGQAAFYRQYAQASEDDTDEIREKLGSISIPVRILWGREDGWLPPTYADE